MDPSVTARGAGTSRILLATPQRIKPIVPLKQAMISINPGNFWIATGQFSWDQKRTIQEITATTSAAAVARVVSIQPTVMNSAVRCRGVKSTTSLDGRFFRRRCFRLLLIRNSLKDHWNAKGE